MRSAILFGSLLIADAIYMTSGGVKIDLGQVFVIIAFFAACLTVDIHDFIRENGL